MAKQNPLTDEALQTLMAFAAPECVDAHEVDERALLDYADGLDDRAGHIQAHLDRCAFCRELVEVYREEANAVQPRSIVGPTLLMAAAAAALVAFVALDDQTQPVAYEVGAVDGLVAEQMGSSALDSGRTWRVAPTSRLRIVLRPTVETELLQDAAAGLFVETPHGIYRRANADVTRSMDGQNTAFTIRANGPALLAQRGTRNRIVLVIAESSAVLDALAGRRRPRAGRDGVLHVTERRIVDVTQRR